MPTVLRRDGYRVVVFFNDHVPAHVHVFVGSDQAIFFLNCPDGPLELHENHGLSRSYLSRISAALRPHVAFLCEEWRRIHDRT